MLHSSGVGILGGTVSVTFFRAFDKQPNWGDRSGDANNKTRKQSKRLSAQVGDVGFEFAFGQLGRTKPLQIIERNEDYE